MAKLNVGGNAFEFSGEYILELENRTDQPVHAVQASILIRTKTATVGATPIWHQEIPPNQSITVKGGGQRKRSAGSAPDDIAVIALGIEAIKIGQCIMMPSYVINAAYAPHLPMQQRGRPWENPFRK